MERGMKVWEYGSMGVWELVIFFEQLTLTTYN